MKLPLDIQLKAAGLDDYVTELRFCPPRRWRFDYAWVVDRKVWSPDVKVALEIEGGTWAMGRHVRATGYENDCRKYNEAACMGWVVIRATTKMVDDGSAVEYVRRALGR